MNDSPSKQSIIAPETTGQLCELIVETSQVFVVGNQTKSALCRCDDATIVSMRSHSGMIEYEPSEFTFTARAGTPIAELSDILAEKNQYLPFDPMLVEAGATIGGTVASGMSGPGRFRYGGIRDFLLGVQFVSGEGKVINSGGKVVKNAAGFDIPKFFVGSLGRFGVMTELTFKVFPKPPSTQSLQVTCESHEQAIERMSILANSRWEIDAIDYRSDERLLYVRQRGPEEANRLIAEEIQAQLGSDLADADDNSVWQSTLELNWQPNFAFAIKVPATPPLCRKISDLFVDRTDISIHWSACGNVLWILAKEKEQMLEVGFRLTTLGVAGLVIRGDCQCPGIALGETSPIENALKAAMDPKSKYPLLRAKVS